MTRKCSKFEKAVILSKMIFSFSKRQVHIFNMSATIVQSFRLTAQKLWEELIIQSIFLERTDGWTDRQTLVKHNAPSTIVTG